MQKIRMDTQPSFNKFYSVILLIVIPLIFPLLSVLSSGLTNSF